MRDDGLSHVEVIDPSPSRQGKPAPLSAERRSLQQQCGWARRRIDWNSRNDSRSYCRCIGRGVYRHRRRRTHSVAPERKVLQALVPKRDGPRPTRLGSLARVAPETGWNPGNHRQNPFCRVTSDAFIVTPSLAAAAVRCGCLSFS
jgi:hypothetical protein